MDAQTSECPTHCAQCSRELLWRRPWRTHCEICKPIMRGVDLILAGRPADEGPEWPQRPAAEAAKLVADLWRVRPRR